ncbi:unnamed protein product [Caenorhabditis sp. 36 PRJEB53466]|nr:unnamed protein product [Caenorhabditis sp. 36 PRJEB53466]
MLTFNRQRWQFQVRNEEEQPERGLRTLEASLAARQYTECSEYLGLASVATLVAQNMDCRVVNVQDTNLGNQDMKILIAVLARLPVITSMGKRF